MKKYIRLPEDAWEQNTCVCVIQKEGGRDKEKSAGCIIELM